MRLLFVTLLMFLLLAFTVPASADIIFTLGNNPQPGEENVLLNGGTSGSSVTGTTNISGLNVLFTSTTDILTEPSNGQARIEATDGLVNNVTITVPGGTFADLIANPHGTGDTTVTVVDNNGVSHTFSYTLGHGENFLTITTANGETISSVTFDDANGGFTDLRQIRISGATVTPEPASLLLLGTGLACVGIFRRRSSR